MNTESTHILIEMEFITTFKCKMDLVNGIPTIDNQEIKQQEINYGKHLENELVEENGLNLARSTSI